MEPVAALGYLLQHTASTMTRQSDQILQERLGIGMSQLKILTLLQDEPNIRQRTLADRLGQTEASISRQIKLLEEKQLLAVRVNPKSRREHLAVPTGMGIKITKAALEIIDQYNASQAGSLSDKQLRQLIEALVAVHGHTCAPNKPFACDHPFEI